MKNDNNNKTAYRDTDETFVEKFQRGECSEDDISKYIEKWHAEYNGPMELHEFLGMTEKQYEKWLVDSDCLPILFPKKIRKKSEKTDEKEENRNKKKEVQIAKNLVNIAKKLIDD